ncbi:serine hydrolase [Bacillus spongiae]|uniref:Serine hydrolase n=1 Tax=Bacillus spongiae TaxID=2683610 RepID=A0ABU8HFG9_9BACI
MKLEVLKPITTGDYGAVVYSIKDNKQLFSQNSNMVVPLASAGKLLIGLAIAKWVKGGQVLWNTTVPSIFFDPHEDSSIVYPHLQGRESLSLEEAVEVMIACHDNAVAKRVVDFLGGWEKIHKKIQEDYPTIHLLANPRDPKNEGSIHDLFHALMEIYRGYKNSPDIFSPIITGMVRQQEAIEEIPKQHLAHMTGGLPDFILDMGVLGEFTKQPLLYVLVGNQVPNRSKCAESDQIMENSLRELYRQYKAIHQMKEMI